MPLNLYSSIKKNEKGSDNFWYFLITLFRMYILDLPIFFVMNKCHFSLNYSTIWCENCCKSLKCSVNNMHCSFDFWKTRPARKESNIPMLKRVLKLYCPNIYTVPKAISYVGVHLFSKIRIGINIKNITNHLNKPNIRLWILNIITADIWSTCNPSERFIVASEHFFVS